MAKKQGIDYAENIVRLDELRELLDYSPESGFFIWKRKLGRRIKRGDVAGCQDSQGYWVIGIHGLNYKGHRLAYFYMTGEWPIEADHINGQRSDNRWLNLRNLSRADNAKNRVKKQKNNTSGFKGVVWHKRDKRWQAQIKHKGKTNYLGSYKTQEDAADAYQRAALALFGEFIRQ